METQIRKEERNYGIDLLRIIAMYMVVVLHILGCGGILETCKKFSLNYYVAWFLETAAYCAVDVFAMISGYVMVNTKFNGFKMIPLWLTVFFYSSIITILFKFVPSLSILHEVTKKELIEGIILPVVSHQYWYFTAYFGMYFFIPFINKMIQNLEKKEYKVLCLTIIIVFSLLPILGLKRVDSFNMGWGYTTAWLICLYIIGGYFKNFPIKISKMKCFFMYIISIFCAWFSKFISHTLIKQIFKMDKELDLFIDYTSIFIISSGIALLLLFYQIEIKNHIIEKIISFVSSLAFSVYIIHVQPFVFNYIFSKKFEQLAFENPILLVLKVLIFALLIFLVCWSIDLIRYFIFRICKIHKIPKILYNKYSKA